MEGGGGQKRGGTQPRARALIPGQLPVPLPEQWELGSSQPVVPGADWPVLREGEGEAVAVGVGVHGQSTLLFCGPCRAPLAPEEAGRLAAERARAPVVPFGVDLCNWGQEQPAAGKVLK